MFSDLPNPYKSGGRPEKPTQGLNPTQESTKSESDGADHAPTSADPGAERMLKRQDHKLHWSKSSEGWEVEDKGSRWSPRSVGGGHPPPKIKREASQATKLNEYV